jgi:hypothetical protein
MEEFVKNNDFGDCLRKVKNHLEEDEREHMGTGEMLRLIWIMREEVSRCSRDEYLVRKKKEIYAASHSAMHEYLKMYRKLQ